MDALRIGAVLKKKREELGMTQTEVISAMQDKETNISRETLSKIETGNRNVSARELSMLCNILGIDIELFFQEDEDLVTLFRRKAKEYCSDEMIERVRIVQAIAETFIKQKEICDNNISRRLQAPMWEV